MEAIILAGGMGTRLSKTVPDLPKPMAPVNGKPFIFYVLNWLKDYHLERIILSTGYKSESIIDYFGDSFCGMPLEYAVEQKALGTGGAIRFAMQMSSVEDVLVLNGDTWFPLQIDRFFLFHGSMNGKVTLALKPMKEFSRFGSVECSKDSVMRFNEKGFCKEGLINGGIYFINRAFFNSLQLPEVFSMETDVLEKLAGSALLKCMIFDDPFIDIGIPEDYRKAVEILKPE